MNEMQQFFISSYQRRIFLNERRRKMEIVCLILGILCLGYYFVILKYAGNSSNFIKIWAVLGGGFLCTFFIIYIRERYGFFEKMIIPVLLKELLSFPDSLSDIFPRNIVFYTKLCSVLSLSHALQEQ